MRLWLNTRDVYADDSQLSGWIRYSRQSSESLSPGRRDNITVDIPGIYVVYSKVTFGCSGHDVNNASIPERYEHNIDAVDGKGGR